MNPYEAKVSRTTTERASAIAAVVQPVVLSRRFRVTVLLVCLPLLFMLFISFPPITSRLPFPWDVPLADAVKNAFDWSWVLKSCLRSHFLTWLFFPPFGLAIFGLVAFLRWPGPFSRMIAAINAMTPLLFGQVFSLLGHPMRHWFIFIPKSMVRFLNEGPADFASALFGKCDGEDWQEAVVFFGTLSVWSYVWAGVAVVITLSNWRSRRGVAEGQTSGGFSTDSRS
jgi:hypothetical protein